MPAPLVLDDDDVIVVERYLAAMRAADRRTGASTTQAARTCQSRIRRAGGWDQLTRAGQVDAVHKARSFTSWLMVTGQIGVDAEQLCDTGLRLGMPDGCSARTTTAGSPKSVLGSVPLPRTRRCSGTRWSRSR